MRKNGLTMGRVLSLYPTLHEADMTKFADVADQIIKKNSTQNVSNIQRIRKASGMTQRKLAEDSNTAFRMIQLYEQRRADINKASAATLSRIAHVLGCRVEDLLE
jgi:DNA-binding transcriptional regulator YiaG